MYVQHRQSSDFTLGKLQTSSSCAEALSRVGLFSSESGGQGLTDGAFVFAGEEAAAEGGPNCVSVSVYYLFGVLAPYRGYTYEGLT